MIALCAGCYAKGNWTKAVLKEFSQLLLALWREQQLPDEQTYLDCNVHNPPAQSVPQ